MTDPDTLRAVERHIRTEYEGVFTEEMQRRFVQEYVLGGTAGSLLDEVRARWEPPATILDIGCGYGSFVLAARDAGYDAIGLEPASFERSFAREQLSVERPQDDPDAVYRDGDGLSLPFDDASIDLVTLWNVLEHVPDYGQLLKEAVRVLRPGGLLLAVAPNYAAFRKEPHYHLPWLPLLPRWVAVPYLRAAGRNPTFFESHIYYCTNVGTRRRLAALNTPTRDPREAKLEQTTAIRSPLVRRLLSAPGSRHVIRALLRMLAANPLKSTIWVEARKRG
jgi:MPBQ/MSBQ methyltransferase